MAILANPPAQLPLFDALPCPKCKRLLPYTSIQPSGHCVECDKERLEKRREYMKRYRKENAEKIRECVKKYSEENAERIREYQTRYRKEKVEWIRERFKRWSLNNSELATQIRQNSRRRRRARARGAEGAFTTKEWLALCDAFSGKCACCHEKLPLTVDHVIPLAKGGSNYIDNIQPLCFSCNASKGAKTIDYRPRKAST